MKVTQFVWLPGVSIPVSGGFPAEDGAEHDVDRQEENVAGSQGSQVFVEQTVGLVVACPRKNSQTKSDF